MNRQMSGLSKILFSFTIFSLVHLQTNVNAQQLMDDSSVSNAAVLVQNHEANYLSSSQKFVPLVLSSPDVRRNLHRRKRSTIKRLNKNRRNLDTLGGGEVPLFRRRSFDSLGGDEVPLIDRRSFDSLGGGEVPLFERRSFDSLGGGEVPLIDRRSFDYLGGGEVPLFERRSFDSLGGGEVPLIDRRSFDSLGGGEVPLIDRRSFDSLGGGEVPLIDRRSFDSLGGDEVPLIDGRSFESEEISRFNRDSSSVGKEIKLLPKPSRVKTYLAATREGRKVHSRQLDSLGGSEVPMFDRDVHH